MAQIDISIHRLDEFVLEVKSSDSTYWLNLTPDTTYCSEGELTFFVESQDQADLLADAFVKCGVRRLESEAAEEPAEAEAVRS